MTTLSKEGIFSWGRGPYIKLIPFRGKDHRAQILDVIGELQKATPGISLQWYDSTVPVIQTIKPKILSKSSPKKGTLVIGKLKGKEIFRFYKVGKGHWISTFQWEEVDQETTRKIKETISRMRDKYFRTSKRIFYSVIAALILFIIVLFFLFIVLRIQV